MFSETEKASLAYNDVILYADAEELTGLNQLPRDFQILPGRRRVSSRMIVCHHYLRG